MSVLDRLSKEQRERFKASDPPVWSPPMLVTLTHDYFSDPDWIFERKFDGERALAICRDGDARLMTRNRKIISDTYPEVIDALRGNVGKECVLDGEVVAFDGSTTSFSRLQKRMHITDRDEARKSGVAVCFYLFDIMYFDCYRLEEVPLRTRKQILKEAVDFSDPLRFTAHRNTEGQAYHTYACERGWEGVIAKRADGPYLHTRSSDWLKFKCGHGQELVIGGFTEPHGSRKGFGALLVGYYQDGKLRYAGKVGTGFDDKTLARLCTMFERLKRETSPFDEDVEEHEVTWLSPKLVGEFGFTEWTRSGKLRHPRFQGLRRDKEAGDVVREDG